MGVGIIAQDLAGTIVAAMCSSRPYIIDPTIAEALGAWKTAELSCTLGLRQIEVEGDALEVVTSLQREGICRGVYGQFVDEAKHLFNHSLSWCVKHVRREANVLAHKLAKFAVLREEEQIWQSDFPDFIKNIVNSEQEVFDQ